jgi:hypothetical protein
MYNSIGDVTKKIIEIETEENLFDLKIEEVYVWELIRVKIYLILVNHYFEKNESISNKQTNIQNYRVKLSKLISKLYKNCYLIFKYPYFPSRNVDSLVFESSRKILFNNEYIDPYTKFYVDELIQSNKTVVRYQSSYKYDRLQKKNKNKSIELIFLLSETNNCSSKNKFLEHIENKIEELNKKFYEVFNYDLNLSSLIKNKLNQFKKRKRFFYKLLKKTNPKEIYIVNFCDKSALISASKELEIKIIDIQHGLISSDDIIYHYSDEQKNKLHYFPDYFYAWDKIWKEICGIPLSEDKIKIIGNKYLEARKSNFNHITKEPKTIVIISQPGLTQQIAETTIEYIEIFKNYNVIYKLHPSEFAIQDQFDGLTKLKQLPFVNFASQHDDLYYLFSLSTFVLGVYSTALIEAIEFNCIIYLYNLPGIEMMRTFIQSKMMKKFEPNQFN